MLMFALCTKTIDYKLTLVSVKKREKEMCQKKLHILILHTTQETQTIDTINVKK